MTVLITGAAGFIGSHLAEKLLRDGHRVLGIDNFDPFYDTDIKRQNAEILSGYQGFSLLEADIRDRAAVDRLMAQHPDAVVHLAAKAGVRPSIEQPVDYVDVNLMGTTQLLDSMKEHGVKRMLFASSSSVYGNQAKTPFSESDDVGFPISPYAATKRSGELLCHAYHHLYGMDIACLRFFTVYGPRQRPDLAIRKFTDLALRNQPIPLFGDGSSRRDYTFVDDITDGIRGLLEKQLHGYGIFNLGCGSPVTLLEMVQAIEKALGRKIQIEWLPKQPGDVDQTHADVQKAFETFGYEPKTDLETGVRKFVEWYLR
ncbi:MAG: GDP-mannose 4,6-dehydratase [Saprospiraceae bacterium]|nr:GDP-mannose 4,6-dehydratase [Saprospiraceae bacterium]